MQNRDKNIILRYLLNECNELEFNEVELRLKTSTEFNAEFQILQKLWLSGKSIPDLIQNSDIEIELQKFLSHIQQQEKSIIKITPPKNARNIQFRYIAKIAASIIIVFSLGMFSTWWINSSKYKNINLSSEVIHEVIVPKGGKSIVLLPDGTKVWLNAGSTLKYTGVYGIDSRNVDLEGEAFFSVKTNPHKPFVVNVNNIKIKALGTAFNVKAYPEEHTITTTLEKGILKIEGNGINLTIKPKQNITYYKPEKQTDILQKSDAITQKTIEDHNLSNTIITQSNINTQIYTSWKENKLIIQSDNLAEIATLLERKFDVTVKIESAELLHYKFRGTFQQETLEQILDVISISAPIKYSINKGVITIQPDKKRIENWNSITN